MTDAIITTTLQVALGATLAIGGWLAKRWYSTETQENKDITGLKDTVYGGDDWFQEGVVDVLERHEQEIEDTVNRVGEVEIKVSLVRENNDHVQARLSELTGQDEEPELAPRINNND